MAVTFLSPSDPLFNEIIDFLASSPTREQLIAFKPSERLEQRLDYLLTQNHLDQLTSDEHTELNEFLHINHLINMLKIKARQK